MSGKNRKYYLEFIYNRTIQKLFGRDKKRMDYLVPSDEQVNKIIAERLDSGKPFCLLRPGNGEYSFAQQYDEHLLFGTKRYQKQKMYIAMDGDDHNTKRWCEQFDSDLAEADIVALFGINDIGEQYLLKSYADPKAETILLTQIESHFTNLKYSWLKHLEGKKVLIINPFVEQIEEQYQRKELIWGDREFLPQMEMRYLKSVWYLSKDDNDGFDNWFDALQYLIDKMEQIDFDVALIGCGPFSTFLAAHCKRMGKVGIQYGGALQMLFGVKGARWENNTFYKSYFNEYWVNASKSNAPKNADMLDNTCYW